MESVGSTFKELGNPLDKCNNQGEGDEKEN